MKKKYLKNREKKLARKKIQPNEYSHEQKKNSQTFIMNLKRQLMKQPQQEYKIEI